MTSPAIHVRGVVKEFTPVGGGAVTALESIDLAVPPGEVHALVGPTGCGKTTLLRLIAGLDTPDRGAASVTDATSRAPVGYLTQAHSLLPWLTVQANVELPLRVGSAPAPALRGQAVSLLDRVGLAHQGRLYPHELSGGMRQRVGLARLLATGARCWLLDEPFSALDERTRHRLQDLVLELHEDRGLTVLLVTHGLDEAAYLAQRVHVMSTSPGRIVEELDVRREPLRDRLDPAYGRQVERIRQCLERELL